MNWAGNTKNRLVSRGSSRGIRMLKLTRPSPAGGVLAYSNALTEAA